MRILIFSDLHQFEEDDLEKIKCEFDIMVFLGDIDFETIQCIMKRFPDKPAYCVLGNHDNPNTTSCVNGMLRLENRTAGKDLLHPLIDLNLRKVTVNSVSFTGLQGCVAYKEHQVGYTQDEALQLKIPEADILFSHETEYRFFRPNRYDIAHEGYKVISKYLKDTHPKYHIFGHRHQNIKFTRGTTMCFCVYGCSVFNTHSGIMFNIF